MKIVISYLLSPRFLIVISRSILCLVDWCPLPIRSRFEMDLGSAYTSSWLGTVLCGFSVSYFVCVPRCGERTKQPGARKKHA